MQPQTLFTVCNLHPGGPRQPSQTLFLRWKRLTPRTARHQLRLIVGLVSERLHIVLERLSHMMTWANNMNKMRNRLPSQTRKEATIALNWRANVQQQLKTRATQCFTRSRSS